MERYRRITNSPLPFLGSLDVATVSYFQKLALVLVEPVNVGPVYAVLRVTELIASLNEYENVDELVLPEGQVFPTE